ncbi:hypothetical protein LCGC14_1173400, partial [marine sediment metagenome]
MKEPLIYLVDSDLISKFQIEIRIRQSKRPCKIISFGDTDSAMGMLSSDFGDGPGVPDIIIANFDLPGMDGLSFLRAVGDSERITERTALYIFSDFRISGERKSYEGLAQIRGFFVRPPTRE